MPSPADPEAGKSKAQSDDEDDDEVQVADLAFSEADNKVHAPYGLSVAQLCRLNQLGQEAANLAALQEYGGQEGLLEKLKAHEEDGIPASSVSSRVEV